MKSMERSKRRKKEAPHVEASVNSKEFDPRQLFTPHVQIPGIAPKYQTLYKEEDDSPFIKLLQAINMRASDLPLQSQFPKMDLTSLYCLGITIQEYARHLSTNILTQKLASENAPQLNTLLTPEEIQSRSITAAIEHYKQKKPVKHATTAVINPRPDIRQELSSHARSIKYHQNDPFHVDTVNGDTYYQKMLRSTDWENVLRKDKDPEAAAAAAQLRREKDAKRQAKKSLLKQEEKKRKLDNHLHIPSTPAVNNNHQQQEKYLPLSPPADIFDKASKSKKTSQKKRKKGTESYF